MSTDPIFQARLSALHFQQFRELPHAEMKPEDPCYVQPHYNAFEPQLDYYQELDNSSADYDPRQGHVLLARDEFCEDSPTQVSFHSSGTQASLSRLYLEEPTGGFFEEHFILADDKFHALRVHPQDDACFLTAYHWDRMAPEIAQRQHLKVPHEA